MEQPTNVIVDPQLSLATVLRPMDGYAEVYQGHGAVTPLAFFPPDPQGRYTPLDDEIGSPGISRRLLKYVSVPIGAQCVLYVPHIVYAASTSVIEQLYTYSVHWRVRNPRAMRDSVDGQRPLLPFHMLPYDGASDTTALANQQTRQLIPGATRCVIIEQSEAAGSLEQVQHLRRERMELLTTYLDSTQLPLLLDGTDGEREQGILDPAVFSGASAENIPKASLYFAWSFRAEGDEMSIECVRNDAFSGQPDPWGFQTGEDDEAFFNMYGDNAQGDRRGFGILLFVGG